MLKRWLRKDSTPRYSQGWLFLTRSEGFGVEEATSEPFSTFILPDGHLNSVLVDYMSQSNLGELLRLAEMLASHKKPGDWNLPIRESTLHTLPLGVLCLYSMCLTFSPLMKMG